MHRNNKHQTKTHDINIKQQTTIFGSCDNLPPNESLRASRRSRRSRATERREAAVVNPTFSQEV